MECFDWTLVIALPPTCSSPQITTWHSVTFYFIPSFLQTPPSFILIPLIPWREQLCYFLPYQLSLLWWDGFSPNVQWKQITLTYKHVTFVSIIGCISRGWTLASDLHPNCLDDPNLTQAMTSKYVGGFFGYCNNKSCGLHADFNGNL